MGWPGGGVGVERCGRRGDGDIEESVESGEDERRDVEYEGPVKRELEHFCRYSQFSKPQKSSLSSVRRDLDLWGAKELTYHWDH